MYKKLPKIVSQSSTWTCWAAGMESWLDSTPLRLKETQENLISTYATNDNGGLNPISDNGRDFATLADDFSIEFEVTRRLRLNFIDEHLKISHVLLIFNLFPGVAHTNVVYGIGMPQGTDRMLSVMDPNPGVYVNRHPSFYSKRLLMIGWAAKI